MAADRLPTCAAIPEAKMSSLRALSVALTVCILLALTACGGGRGARLAESEGRRPAPNSGTAPALPHLPAPSAALAQLKGASAVKLRADGADFEAALPHAHVVASGSAATYSPSFAHQLERNFDQLAHAIYRLNLEGQPEGAMLRLAGSPNIDPSQVYVGLADWVNDRWSFSRLGSRPTSRFGSFDTTGFVNGGGDLLVVVVALGIQPMGLGWLSVEPYDEVEPNDDEGSATAIPTPSVAGFAGQLGGADTIDYYTIPGPPSERFDGEIFVTEHETAVLRATLTSAGGTQLSQRELEDGYQTIYISDDPMFVEADYPLLLAIEQVSGESDYFIRFIQGPDTSIFFAGLQAEPAYVELGQSVTLTPEVTVGEVPPGYVFRWDLDDNGTTDAYTTEMELTWTYGQSGLYKPEMIARSPEGRETYADVLVAVGDIGYDERENNDTEETANPLDPAKFDNWRGNLWTKYDQDEQDWYSLELEGGLAALLSVENLGNQSGELYLDGFFFPGLNQDDPLMLSNPLPETQSFAFSVRGDAGDYRLSWQYGHPPVIVLDNPPGDGTVPYEITVNATVSDADGDSFGELLWDFDQDDVIDATGNTATYTYETQGDKQVRVWCYDEHGFRGVSGTGFWVAP
jgi:hypothetical protein